MTTIVCIYELYSVFYVITAWQAMVQGMQERVPWPTLSRTVQHWKSFGKCQTHDIHDIYFNSHCTTFLKLLHPLVSCKRLTENCITRTGVERLIEALKHNIHVKSIWYMINTELYSRKYKSSPCLLLMWFVYVIGGCLHSRFGAMHGHTASFSAKKNCGC